MTKRTIEGDFAGFFRVSFDDSLLPDDEWRHTFYNINTLEDLAIYFCWNCGIHGARDANRLDGFCDVPHADEVRAVDMDMWDFEAKEVTP